MPRLLLFHSPLTNALAFSPFTHILPRSLSPLPCALHFPPLLFHVLLSPPCLRRCSSRNSSLLLVLSDRLHHALCSQLLSLPLRAHLLSLSALLHLLARFLPLTLPHLLSPLCLLLAAPPGFAPTLLFTFVPLRHVLPLRLAWPTSGLAPTPITSRIAHRDPRLYPPLPPAPSHHHLLPLPRLPLLRPSPSPVLAPSPVGSLLTPKRRLQAIFAPLTPAKSLQPWPPLSASRVALPAASTLFQIATSAAVALSLRGALADPTPIASPGSSCP